MSSLNQLCPDGKFNSIAEYESLLEHLNELVSSNIVHKIEPRRRDKWDAMAIFYFDPLEKETFKLVPPEFPSRGEWTKVKDA